MSVPNSREALQTFNVHELEEVLWYARRPLGESLEMYGGSRSTSFQVLAPGSICIREQDLQPSGETQGFLRLDMPVCRAPQASSGASFNIVGLKAGGFDHVSDDRTVYLIPRSHPHGALGSASAPGSYHQFGNLEPGARILLSRRDGIPMPRSGSFIKLHFPVVPVGTRSGDGEVFTAAVLATGELVSLPRETLVIPLG